MNVTLKQAARERLPRWNGQSVQSLARDPQLTPQDAAVLGALGPDLQRVTGAGLEALSSQAEERYQDCVMRLATPRTLFTGLPDPARVRQGQQPDCVLTSTAIALAHQRPYHLMHLLEETRSGYDLSLPGQRPRQGALPSDLEVVTQSCAYGSGLWMTVLGKELGPVGRVLRGRAIQALTGNGSDTDVLKMQFGHATRKKLKFTLENDGVVLAGRSMIAADVKGLTREHSYAVLDFDPKTDLVSLQDPAGNEPLSPQGEPLDGRQDGRFSVSLTEFRDWFSTVTYEKRATQKKSSTAGHGSALLDTR